MLNSNNSSWNHVNVESLQHGNFPNLCNDFRVKSMFYSLYHHFCCSGWCFHLFNLYSFTCTGDQHYFHIWWHSRRLAVTRDKNCSPFWSTWIHPSVYWGSCCSIYSFMCNIIDYYLSFCPHPFWSVYWFETSTSICEI